MARTGKVAASRGSDPGLHARRLAALLLLALAPAPAVAQRMPQPIFTELFACDPPEYKAGSEWAPDYLTQLAEIRRANPELGVLPQRRVSADLIADDLMLHGQASP